MQISQGNELALVTLYNHYGALVYTVALRITHQPLLAEKVVQGVFSVVWQSAHSIQPGVILPIWLMSLARQHALAAAHLPVHDTPAHPQPHTFRHGEQGAEDAQALAIRRALDRLPPDQRETLELAYYERLTCHEIASRLREPVSTIKTRLRIGLGTLANAHSDLAERNTR